jgi:hypothetical protein
MPDKAMNIPFLTRVLDADGDVGDASYQPHIKTDRHGDKKKDGD